MCPLPSSPAAKTRTAQWGRAGRARWKSGRVTSEGNMLSVCVGGQEVQTDTGDPGPRHEVPLAGHPVPRSPLLYTGRSHLLHVVQRGSGELVPLGVTRAGRHSEAELLP